MLAERRSLRDRVPRLRDRGDSPWLTAALTVVLLGLVLIVAALPARSAVPAGARAAAWSKSIVPVTVVGDSLTSGYRTPGDPWTLPAQELLDSDGVPMTLTNASGPGSGYVAKGAFGDTFADYVRLGVTRGTKLVVLFGSDNDLSHAQLAPGYASAVSSTLELVHSIAPAALVVVVGPPGTIQNPASSLEELNGVLQAVAASQGAIFVNALDWFAGKDAGYLGPDGEHPDVAGEAYLATRFVDLLQSLRPGRANLTTRMV